MKYLNSLVDVKNALEKKYSAGISDFHLYIDKSGLSKVIKGGFYEMSCGNNRYYFHEIHAGKDENESYDELYSYIDKAIQKKLKWQKEQDENYAQEFNKKIEYKFDYSLINEG